MGAYTALRRGEEPDPEPSDTVIVPEQLGIARDIFQGTDAAVRAAANAVTLNQADRAAAVGDVLTGQAPNYDAGLNAQLALSRKARTDYPLSSIGGDVAGAAMVPGIGGRTLAAHLGGGFAARAAGHGAEGAVYGGLGGLGYTSPGSSFDRYMENMGYGSVLGGVLGMGFGGPFGRGGPMQSTAKSPTAKELQAELTANYDALRKNAGLYEPKSLFDASFPAEAAIKARRARDEDIPYALRGIAEMRGDPSVFPLGRGAPVSPADIDMIRQGVNQATSGKDLAAGRHVKSALDAFLASPPPGSVLPGTEAAAAEASALSQRATGNTAAQHRVQAVENLIKNAETRGGFYNLGPQLESNAAGFVRQKGGRSPASKAGLDPTEIASFENFANPGITVRGALSAASGGLGMAGLGVAGAGGGSAYGYFKEDPASGAMITAAPLAAGLAMRMGANRGASRDIGALRDMVANRSPLFRERAVNAPMQPPPGKAADVIRNYWTGEILKQRMEE